MANFATRVSFTKTFSIVSNISVVLGLIFLVIELKQNNDFMQQNAEYMRSQSLYNYYSQRSAISRSNLVEPLYTAYAKILSGQEITFAETIAINAQINSFWEFWEYEYYELKANRISLEQFNITAKMKVVKTLPMFVQLFKEYLMTAPEEIKEFWDAELVKAGI
jgi:hypothetical protein